MSNIKIHMHRISTKFSIWFKIKIDDPSVEFLLQFLERRDVGIQRKNNFYPRRETVKTWDVDNLGNIESFPSYLHRSVSILRFYPPFFFHFPRCYVIIESYPNGDTAPFFPPVN